MENKSNTSQYGIWFQTLYQILIIIYAPIFIITKVADVFTHSGMDWVQIAKISVFIFVSIFGFLGFVKYYAYPGAFENSWLGKAIKTIFQTKLILLYLIMFGFSSYHSGVFLTKTNETRVFHWKLATTWESNLPILSDMINRMAEEITKESKGMLDIEVFSSGRTKDSDGQTIKGQYLFKAISEGKIQMLHSAPYYWMDTIPEAVFFGAIPFGMDHEEMDAWMDKNAEGYALWKKVYSKYNLIPYSCGHTGPQMGGWFKKEIKTISDFNGIKMRIAGLGGAVLAKFGVRPTRQAQPDIFPALNNGDIDAAEWIGPYHDHELGLDSKGMYYYSPGWQEPNTMFEMVINKSAFDELPSHLQTLLEIKISQYNIRIYEEFMKQNSLWAEKMKRENVPFREFSKDIIESLRHATDTVLDEYINQPGMNKEIYLSYQNFNTKVKFSSHNIQPQCEPPLYH